MEPVLWLLISLVCTVLGAPSSAPVMQLSAQESSADDPYDDEITIIAEPYNPFFHGFPDSLNAPSLRAGLTQQTSSNYFWPNYQTAGVGNLGNKWNLGNIGSFLQNLQSVPLTVNVPNAVNGVNNQFSNFWTRWQQFLNQAQQSAAQWQANLQNTKGDQYYQYGLPSHPYLYQITHPYGSNNGYFKSVPIPEEDSYAPAYQVIAVMPVYNAPPVKVADLLRQRSLGYDKPQSDMPSEVVVDSNIAKTVEKEVKKNLKDDLKEISVFEEKDIKNFASGVAKEVASAVAEAAKHPGKVTEVMVRVDAKTDDDDDDSSSSSSSSSEEDVPAVIKKEGDKKKNEKDEDVSDSDSSDSSDSSSSEETSTTAPLKTTTQKIKTPVKNSSVEGGQSGEDSDEDSVEKIARESLGSRPVKAELVKPISSKH